jgi:predicted aldo/keto reductase-like oxidoreductase
MKLQDYLNKNGARQTAEKLVDNRIIRITGLSMHDLPDTTEVWDIVEELEAILENDNFDIQGIKDILNEITLEYIEEICM